MNSLKIQYMVLGYLDSVYGEDSNLIITEQLGHDLGVPLLCRRKVKISQEG